MHIATYKVDNKDFLYSTWNYIQYIETNYNGNELGKKNIHTYIHTCVQACPGTSVVSNSLRPHGLSPARLLCLLAILQARILEWAAMPSSRGSSLLRDRTCISYISCTSREVLDHEGPLGSPHTYTRITKALSYPPNTNTTL